MNLSIEDTQLFYKLQSSLLAYANRQFKILPPNIKAAEVTKQPREQVGRLRDEMLNEPALLDRFLAENPDRLPPGELAIAASWRYRISGDFYIMRYLKAYTVFMSAKEGAHLYGVLGLYDPIEAVLGGIPLPIMVKAALLPFKSQIIYDGLMNYYSISFGAGIRSSFGEAYSRLKEQEGIIEQLVGPDGQPEIRTNLARRAPRKPAPDWRPALAEIAAQVDKMHPTNTKLQGAAITLLHAAAELAQAAFQAEGAEAEAAAQLRAVRRAMAKLERMLGQWEYE